MCMAIPTHMSVHIAMRMSVQMTNLHSYIETPAAMTVALDTCLHAVYIRMSTQMHTGYAL